MQRRMLILAKAPFVRIREKSYFFGFKYDLAVSRAYLLMRDKQDVVDQFFIEAAVGKGMVLRKINGIYRPEQGAILLKHVA